MNTAKYARKNSSNFDKYQNKNDDKIFYEHFYNTILRTYITFKMGRRGGSMGRRGGSMGRRGGSMGRRGGSMVVRQTVVLQSRVRILRLPSPQLIAHLLVGCHLRWHLAVG